MPLKFREVAGVRIRYALSEKPGAAKVLLCNPLPQSILAFAPIWGRLTEHFEVFAYDLPGFGRSEGGSEFMTFDAQGKFLADLINAFSIEQPHIVGPDIGMPTAMSYAADHPNQVGSLFVGDGPSIAPSSNGSIINQMANSSIWRMIMKVAGAGALVSAGHEVGYVNYVPNNEELTDYVASYKHRIGQVLEWFKNYPDSLADLESKVDQISAPTLIFWGANDRLLLPDNASRLDRRLQHSKVHVFDRCGHFAYQDQYQQFGEQLIQWVHSGHEAV